MTSEQALKYLFIFETNIQKHLLYRIVAHNQGSQKNVLQCIFNRYNYVPLEWTYITATTFSTSLRMEL